jgi:hypothetical protein
MSTATQIIADSRHVAAIGLRGDAGSGIVETVRARGLDLSAETINMLEKLDKYDLSLVTNKFSDFGISIEHMTEQAHMVHTLTGRLDPEMAKSLELDFKRWVALFIIYPDEAIAPPSRLVDMYWHLAILHSKEYGEFCRQVIGKYMGHAPTTEESKTEVEAVTLTTRSRFAWLFGTSLVTNLLRCNASCSGGYCTSNCSGSDCTSGNCKSDCQANI